MQYVFGINGVYGEREGERVVVHSSYTSKKKEEKSAGDFFFLVVDCVEKNR